MLLILFILINLGFIHLSLSNVNAPAFLTMIITTESQSNNVVLSYEIKNLDKTGNPMIENSLITMTKRDRNQFSAKLNFRVENINQKMELKAELKEIFPNIHEFLPREFQYNLNYTQYVDTNFIITISLMSKDFKRELKITLKADCDQNYYPRNVCTKYCIETSNTRKCDSNGVKHCSTGYYLNKESQLCETDWCQTSTEKCQNNGLCVNSKDSIYCTCPQNYKGKYCDVYVNLCDTYKCPNHTMCIVEDLKVSCLKANEIKTQLSSASIYVILIIVFIIIIIIITGILLYKCNQPKNQMMRANYYQNEMSNPPTLNRHIYHHNTVDKAAPLMYNGQKRNSNAGCNCAQDANASQWDSHNYFYSLRPNSFRHARLNRTLSDQVVSRHQSNSSASIAGGHRNSFNYPQYCIPITRESIINNDDANSNVINSTNHDYVNDELTDTLPNPPTLLRSSRCENINIQENEFL